jgi:hypothetical protein
MVVQLGRRGVDSRVSGLDGCKPAASSDAVYQTRATAAAAARATGACSKARGRCGRYTNNGVVAHRGISNVYIKFLTSVARAVRIQLGLVLLASAGFSAIMVATPSLVGVFIAVIAAGVVFVVTAVIFYHGTIRPLTHEEVEAIRLDEEELQALREGAVDTVRKKSRDNVQVGMKGR